MPPRIDSSPVSPGGGRRGGEQHRMSRLWGFGQTDISAMPRRGDCSGTIASVQNAAPWHVGKLEYEVMPERKNQFIGSKDFGLQDDAGMILADGTLLYAPSCRLRGHRFEEAIVLTLRA